MPDPFERKAEILAYDLSTERTQDAAYLLRNQIMQDPREALALIQRAKELKNPGSPDDVVIMQNGDVVVKDYPARRDVFAGTLPYEVVNGWGRGNGGCDPCNDGRQGPPIYGPQRPGGVIIEGGGNGAEVLGGVILGTVLGAVIAGGRNHGRDHDRDHDRDRDRDRDHDRGRGRGNHR